MDGRPYGLVDKECAALLLSKTSVFVVDGKGIALSPTFNTFTARSHALMQATEWMCHHTGKALRNELYAVTANWGEEPVAQIDRVAVPWFGVRAWGVHVNGFVRKADGIYLWIGERAADRLAEPGKLDNMIGGGQPIGLSLEDNLCKEAQEEAGIEASLALTAKRVTTLNYCLERKEGLRTDTLFIYDLELPQDFIPHNTDGEVAAFHLLPLADVAALVHDTDKFKFNCNMVVIDFLLRHGFITPQDAEYTDLRAWLTPN
jgi:8-oxo-dGTP pyrophosphatase MutT (NUDIX family)